MHDKLLIIPFRVISKRINNFSFVESDFFFFVFFSLYIEKKTTFRCSYYIYSFFFSLSFLLSSIDGRSSLFEIFFFFVSFCAPIRSIYVCVEFFFVPLPSPLYCLLLACARAHVSHFFFFLFNVCISFFFLFSYDVSFFLSLSLFLY